MFIYNIKYFFIYRKCKYKKIKIIKCDNIIYYILYIIFYILNLTFNIFYYIQFFLILFRFFSSVSPPTKIKDKYVRIIK
jgi:hypothetical protein